MKDEKSCLTTVAGKQSRHNSKPSQYTAKTSMQKEIET